MVRRDAAIGGRPGERVGAGGGGVGGRPPALRGFRGFGAARLPARGALLLGGTITLLPVFLALTRPGSLLTRSVIAIAQMLMFGLLIHLTGGRIETHFHVFGSLAFLAFYREGRIILLGSFVTAADHFLRGSLWTQSIYGVETVETWRWLEHAGWVVFEDVFLLLSCATSRREVYSICERDAAMEAQNDGLERKVAERTREAEHLAYHDALTNLPNRLLFRDRLEQVQMTARWQKKDIAVLYLDLDNFKRINDTQGHEAGDVLLREAALRLSQCLEAKDTLARMGGDEFTILLAEPRDREAVQNVAERILEHTGLPPKHLKLEITESVFLGDTEEVLRKLQELKALGIKLAIDDFGTGYSSMSTLRAFPVDTVKIDRAFIKRLNEEEGAAIVAAIISLAKAMHLDVIGEGIETAEQVVQLQGFGCDTAQGYFFAKPLPGKEREGLLESGAVFYQSRTSPLSAAHVLELLEEIDPEKPEPRKAA